jgi:DNA-3-methyladenine glycosylase I
MGEPRRCAWVTDDPIYRAYHDDEWGRPLRDERALFELLVLEGAQAGLSWLLILKKRGAYRRAFAGFDPRPLARFDRRRVERLMHDAGIVRNRLKIESAVANARAWLRLREEVGSPSEHLWSFVGGEPKRNRWKDRTEVPSRTAESDAMSKDLKKRGFKFVGSTICYAFMEACGMVMDHTRDCAWSRPKKGARRAP